MMLLKSKIEKFIAKRVLILLIILSIIVFVFTENKWTILSGLAIGGVFSLLRFTTLSSSLVSILNPDDNTNTPVMGVFRYIISQVSLILLLVVSAKFHIYFFIGMIAGIFLVPLVILINGVTEGFGITHNNFE